MNVTLPLGRIVATPGAVALLERLQIDPRTLLVRHWKGDWGVVDEEDWETNNQAVEDDLRVISAYGEEPDRVWIITEADRSVTTILLPEEY